ncbi:MAG: low-density lipoprotein receptor class A repeat-containing protein [Nannocystaceae bacterium]
MQRSIRCAALFACSIPAHACGPSLGGGPGPLGGTTEVGEPSEIGPPADPPQAVPDGSNAADPEPSHTPDPAAGDIFDELGKVEVKAWQAECVCYVKWFGDDLEECQEGAAWSTGQSPLIAACLREIYVQAGATELLACQLDAAWARQMCIVEVCAETEAPPGDEEEAWEDLNRCYEVQWQKQENCPDPPPGVQEMISEQCYGQSEPFDCNSGEVIPGTWVCDGTADCEDGSDEHAGC